MARPGQLLKKSYDSKVLRVGQSTFWAERGLIHWEEESGRYGSLTMRAFLRHIDGLCGMLGKTSARQDHIRDASLRAEYQELVERALVLVREAQEQGMPSDASARRDLVRRRAKTICVSGGSSFM